MTFSLVVLAFIFITGLVIGSFLNVVILRTVSEESIVFPASKCPKCQTPLKWYHNIPLFSYMFLRGKCAFCHEHISWQYPFVELLTGLIFVGLFLRICTPFDPLFGLEVMNPIAWPQVILYIFSLIISCLFIVLSGTDFIEKKVADVHTFALIGVGIFYSILVSILIFIFNVHANGMPKFSWDLITSCPILYSMAAGILGFLIMEAVSRLGLLLVGARAFGEGDTFIAAGLGAIFGWRTLLVVLVLSVIVQVVLFLPIFIRDLVKNKDWKTLISFAVFCIFAIIFYSLQHFRIITVENVLIFSIGAIILAVLGVISCMFIFKGLRENPENRTYLPFGPAMVIAAFAALLL